MEKFEFYIRGRVKAKDKVSVLIGLERFVKYYSIEGFDFKVKNAGKD